MFSSLRAFLNRHRRKFIITGVVVGGAVFATRYAHRKFREWQERETREFLERTRRQQHYENTERTCNQTILSLAPKVMEAVAKTLNTDDLIVKLRSGNPDKVALWEEIKILAFTRASVIVYAYAMLVVTLRVEMNLICGYMFRDVSDGKGAVSSEVQQKYLSLSHHFLIEGISELCSLVQKKVKYIMGGIPLKRRLNLNDTEQLFWALQAAIANDGKDPAKKVAHYVIPQDPTVNVSDGEASATALNTMIMETWDLLESDEVSSLMSSLISQGFSNVVDRVSEYFIPNEVSKASLNSQTSQENPAEPVPGPSTAPNGIETVKELKNGHVNGIGSFVHPNSIDMAMAKLIPIVNGLGQGGHAVNPDPWLQQLILDDRLKMLGANVYEAFGYKE